MAGKTGVGYTPGAGTEIASWLDNESDAHQLTVLEYLPASTGTADPLPVSPQNPLPVALDADTANIAQETGGNLASIATSNSVIATDIASVEASAATIATAQGNAGTGLAEPAGGAGILGFLSGIFHALAQGQLTFDGSGNLNIKIAAGAASGGTSIADGSTFTAGTTPETPVGAVVTTGAQTLTVGKVNALSQDAAGNLFVNLNAGAATAGTAGTPSSDVATIQGAPGMTPVQVTEPLTTTGGASYSNEIAPATPAAVAVKTSAGNVYGVTAMNLGATPVYIKFWDTASAPTLGSTAANYQFMVPGNSGGAGVVIQFNFPRSHANRIYYAVTGGIALADNTSITGNSVVVDVAYN